MSELTYKELCDHEYVQAYIAELRDDYNAELKKHGELEAENAQLKSSVRELEENLEKYAWSYSPAMAEAKIDQLNKEVEQLKHDYEQLKELYDAKIASVPIGPIVGAQTIVNQEMEINKLKAELVQCQQAAKFGCCEICGATSWTQSKTEGPHTTRMVAGGVTTYWRCDRCWLKQQLHEATQREARLVSLLKRSRDVLQWDGAAYTILQEDIAEELTEEAGT